MSTIHKHFGSASALASYCEEIGVGTSDSLGYWHGSGCGHDSKQRALNGVRLLRKGDLSHVDDALKLLDQFTQTLEVPTRKWRPGVTGAFPNVPAYLAGHPASMFMSVRVPDDRTPIRVWMGTGCTVVFEDDEIIKRGVAVAAFAIALSRVRPVYITPYMNGHDWNARDHGIISYDLQTSPIVLSEIMACIANPDITRHVWIPAIRVLNPRVGHGVPFRDVRREHIPAIQPQDLFIPPMIKGDELISNPVAWIKRQLDKYTQDVTQ